MLDEITPVLLAGGYGTRLWPLSRKSFPKQFSKIVGDQSIFQQTAIRLTSSDKIKFKSHLSITNAEFRFFVTQQLNKIGIKPGAILIEPEPKNTAPAILATSLYSFYKDNNSVLLFAPTDHLILDIDEFHKALLKGLKEVQKGKIVTFGIQPTKPETGYGYLKLEKTDLNLTQNLLSFVEKPNKERARKMLAKGNYLWNSGLFLFRSRDIIKAFKEFDPDTFNSVEESLHNSKSDLDFIKLDEKAWSKCRNISIDYAIMEKSKNLSVVPFSGGWTDLGDWNKVWQEMEISKENISLSKNAHAFDCKNVMLRSEKDDQTIVGLGLENIIAIAMHDAVLIADKDRTQEIGNVVKNLKSKNITQAEFCLEDYRPWGFYQILAMSDKFKVKKIFVNPKSSLSLQSHNYRSEHWVVVKGMVDVTIEKKIKTLKEGESVYVPKRSIHRIDNPYKSPVIIIEIQIGSYLGEDDIIRYEDIYSRN